MIRFITSIFSLALIAFCTLESASAATTHIPEAGVTMNSERASAVAELAGTTWQLVKIMSMDDSIYQPKDNSKYTLDFNADGSNTIQADCNHGIGAWQSEYPGQLQFGPIDSSHASCLQGSLSGIYLAQFEWVRSYIIKDSHLFLATKADGSIIEFEPAAMPLAATVFGEEIHTNDATELQRVILSRLFERYAAEHNLDATEEEIDNYVEYMRHALSVDSNLTAEDKLTLEEAAQVKTMRREMGRSLIRHWKLNRALYRQYGGRVIFQQLGPEPLDAYRQYLDERQANGDFTIHEKAFEERFWRYFIDDSIHTFYEAGSEAGAFESLPWQ